MRWSTAQDFGLGCGKHNLGGKRIFETIFSGHWVKISWKNFSNFFLNYLKMVTNTFLEKYIFDILCTVTIKFFRKNFSPKFFLEFSKK